MNFFRNSYSKMIFYVCLLVAVLMKEASGLDCYKCSNCKTDIGTQETCDSSDDVCIKFQVSGLVHKSCSRKELCSLKELEKSLKSLWDNVKKAFGDDKDSDAEDMVSCCDSSYCNSAYAPENALGLSGVLLLSIFHVFVRA